MQMAMARSVMVFLVAAIFAGAASAQQPPWPPGGGAGSVAERACNNAKCGQEHEKGSDAYKKCVQAEMRAQKK